ncbi:Uncharacterized protein TPAR_05623 [Tolypocladium paradoxum]|uniref:Uncharacterized protein n=1 Tax=Tolypocladium paradoxum TaxID=94208 RepID=A0A2S4KVG3_9HYPO|nr:Uncharacterized protein TPAR_05623 [Tolypocladium paradoxum]
MTPIHIVDMASDDKPKTITGRCLCESVRYTITFPPDRDFANAVRPSPSLRHRTIRRKQTGSLARGIPSRRSLRPHQHDGRALRRGGSRGRRRQAADVRDEALGPGARPRLRA